MGKMPYTNIVSVKLIIWCFCFVFAFTWWFGNTGFYCVSAAINLHFSSCTEQYNTHHSFIKYFLCIPFSL